MEYGGCGSVFFITKVPVFGELKTENLRKQGVQRFSILRILRF